jgi:hypothetical protein
LAFTFFFRDQQVLEFVVEHALPILSSRSHSRIREAGAAIGFAPGEWDTSPSTIREELARCPR